MGTLVSAFLSAESGRKLGQNACGVQLREREKKKKQSLNWESKHHTKREEQLQNDHCLKAYWVLSMLSCNLSSPQPHEISKPPGERFSPAHEETGVKKHRELHSQLVVKMEFKLKCSHKA